MDYSLLVGVHHKELGNSVDTSAFPRRQQQARHSGAEEDWLEERGRRLPVLRRDDGGVQGADANEVACDV